MRRVVLAVTVTVLAACGSSVASTTAAPATTTTAAATSTTALEECAAIPYQVGVLPARVQPDRPAPDDVPRDEFTSILGTRSQLWFDGAGHLAVAFVRGALPPRDWPGDKGEVSIDGARGVAGKLEDGTWMVAWYEGKGDRCDRFFLVFYPPVDPSEVQATIESLNRVAG